MKAIITAAGEKGVPGYINEWLVAWPQAFCWNTAGQISGTGIDQE